MKKTGLKAPLKILQNKIKSVANFKELIPIESCHLESSFIRYFFHFDFHIFRKGLKNITGSHVSLVKQKISSSYIFVQYLTHCTL